MSGKKYGITMAPACHRIYKKYIELFMALPGFLWAIFLIRHSGLSRIFFKMDSELILDKARTRVGIIQPERFPTSGNRHELRLTKEHENILLPLWKRGIEGDFKINEFIKSPLTPLCQRGVFSGQ
jgi:hypothetical protein